MLSTSMLSSDMDINLDKGVLVDDVAWGRGGDTMPNEVNDKGVLVDDVAQSRGNNSMPNEVWDDSMEE